MTLSTVLFFTAHGIVVAPCCFSNHSHTKFGAAKAASIKDLGNDREQSGGDFKKDPRADSGGEENDQANTEAHRRTRAPAAAWYRQKEAAGITAVLTLWRIPPAPDLGRLSSRFPLKKLL
jgi:hypothetical protein